MISTLFAACFTLLAIGACILVLWNYLLRERLHIHEEKARSLYAGLRYWKERATALEERVLELEKPHQADWWKEAE